MGETAIRAQIGRGTIYPYATDAEANEWLDEVFFQRMERANSEQIKLTREGNTVGRQARNAARAAVVVTIVSILITFLTWFCPRH